MPFVLRVSVTGRDSLEQYGYQDEFLPENHALGFNDMELSGETTVPK